MSYSDESRLETARRELADARKYRRVWAGITAGCAAVTAVAMDLAPSVPGHSYQIHGPLAFAVLAGGAAALGSFTQLLDGTTLVSDKRQDLLWAERNDQTEANGLSSNPDPDVA